VIALHRQIPSLDGAAPSKPNEKYKYLNNFLRRFENRNFLSNNDLNFDGFVMKAERRQDILWKTVSQLMLYQ